jgi:hypothetical protein
MARHCADLRHLPLGNCQAVLVMRRGYLIGLFLLTVTVLVTYSWFSTTGVGAERLKVAAPTSEIMADVGSVRAPLSHPDRSIQSVETRPAEIDMLTAEAAVELVGAEAPPPPKPWEPTFERVRIDHSAFETKYAGRSLADLKQTRDEVYNRWQDAKNRALDERYAAGAYAEEPTRMMRAPGASEESLGFVLEQKGEGQLVRLVSPGDPRCLAALRRVWRNLRSIGRVVVADEQDFQHGATRRENEVAGRFGTGSALSLPGSRFSPCEAETKRVKP